MAFIFGECRQSALQAANLYIERFPNRRHPSVTTFRRLENRMFSTENLVPAAGLDRGRPRLILMPQMDNQVLELFEQDPTRSTRSIVAELNCKLNN